MSISTKHALPTRVARWLPHAAHVASLCVAFVLLMYLARHIWFIYDEWEFISRRIVTGQLDLFRPHNEHWSTVPLLVFKGLFTVFGARTHVPYMAATILLHLGVATMLWLVMRRAGTDPVLVALLTLVFVFFGAGHDDILWAIQVSFNSSVLFGLVQLVLADHDMRFGWRDVGGWIAGTLALMSSGIGLPMLAAAGVAALIRRGIRGALITVSVPALVYAWWLAAIGYHALGNDHITLTEVMHLPVFIWTGVTSTVDGATGLAGAGAVIVLGLLVWALGRDWPLTRPLVAPLAAAAGSVAMFTIIGLARFGIAGTAVPARYIYVAGAFLLPLSAVALTSLTRRRPLFRWGAAAVVALMVMQGAGTLRGWAGMWHQVSEASRERVLAAAQLIASGAPVVGTSPDPNGAPDITTDELRSMVAHGQIQTEAAPTPAVALEVAALMQVNFGAGAALTADPSHVRLVAIGARLLPAGQGCFRFEPTAPLARVEVQASTLADVTLVPDAGAATTADVRWVANPAGAPFPLTYLAPGGAPAHLDIANTALAVTLTIPTAASLCGGHV